VHSYSENPVYAHVTQLFLNTDTVRHPDIRTIVQPIVIIILIPCEKTSANCLDGNGHGNCKDSPYSWEADEVSL